MFSINEVRSRPAIGRQSLKRGDGKIIKMLVCYKTNT
jgi:hypothetical protein